MEDRTCLNCGEAFTPRKAGKPQKFCCGECRVRFNSLARAKHEPMRLTCVDCDVRFDQANGRPADRCEPCRGRRKAQMDAGWRGENADQVKAQNRAWRQAHPDYGSRKMREWYAANKDRAKANTDRWKAENPERHRELKRRSVANRRARMAEAGVFTIIEKDYRRLESAPCVYCGAPSEHIDHVIPIARGGRHSIGNLVPACAACNQSKADKLLVEWLHSA